MKSSTNKNFWEMFHHLPKETQEKAKETYRMFENDPFHKSLDFKRLVTDRRRQLYSVRIGTRYRAVGRMVTRDEVVWFWIGSHREYEKYLRREL